MRGITGSPGAKWKSAGGMPWQASYEAARLLGGNGDSRPCSMEGTSPASSTRQDRRPATVGSRQEPAHRRRVAGVSGEPQRFLVGGDWTRWAGKRAGALTAPPPWGSRRRQVLGEQPVLDKSTKVRSITSRSQT